MIISFCLRKQFYYNTVYVIVCGGRSGHSASVQEVTTKEMPRPHGRGRRLAGLIDPRFDQIKVADGVAVHGVCIAQGEIPIGQVQENLFASRDPHNTSITLVI